MPEPSSVDRRSAADPGSRVRRARLRGREGSGGDVPADRAAAPAGGRAERAGRPARRRRLRLRRARSAARATRRRPSAWPRQGLKFNRFHTTALCSPTRAALLSGRNHHTVGMGGITEIATSAPGYNSIRPNTCAPLAETLKLNGYATAQFGKCHEVPVWETSPLGPFDSWPTRRRRLRVLLRLHRRRDEPVLPGALRGDDAGRARQDAGGGLPLHRGHDRQGDQRGSASRRR